VATERICPTGRVVSRTHQATPALGAAVAAGATDSATIAAPGSHVGDAVTVSGVCPNGVIWGGAWVSAPYVVSVRVYNTSACAVNCSAIVTTVCVVRHD